MLSTTLRDGDPLATYSEDLFAAFFVMVEDFVGAMSV